MATSTDEETDSSEALNRLCSLAVDAFVLVDRTQKHNCQEPRDAQGQELADTHKAMVDQTLLQ